MYDILISYHPVDDEFVNEVLLPELRAAGLSIAIDEEHVRPGAPVVAETERLVTSSRHVVAVLSPEYLASDWDTFEVQLAQFLDPGAVERRLLPVLYRVTALPASIERLRIIDMTNPFSWRARLQQLVDATAPEVLLDDWQDRWPLLEDSSMAQSQTIETRVMRLESELRRLSLRVDGDERFGSRGLAEELVRIAEAGRIASEERRIASEERHSLQREVSELVVSVEKIRRELTQFGIRQKNQCRLPAWAWPIVMLVIVLIFAGILLWMGAQT